jgi:hypothetical protein
MALIKERNYTELKKEITDRTKAALVTTNVANDTTYGTQYTDNKLTPLHLPFT